MLKAGDKIRDYVLVQYLGGGSFGEVWRAEKRTAIDSSEFALKFLRPKNDDSIESDIERVKKELKIWKRVSGLANIVGVIEADVCDGRFYIVSEFADGGSLETFLEQNRNNMSQYEAVKMIKDVLKGLENLHSQNVIHRDLKPANILIKKGVLCLADFGVSWEVKTMSATKTKTGTLQYMPPEAFEKEAKVSPHTDIWAVGVIFQQLLTGSLAFPQDSEPALLAGILFGEPEPLPNSIPRELRQIVEKALRKRREDRFQTAYEMREALDTAWRTLQARTLAEQTTSSGNSADKTLQLNQIPTEWQVPSVKPVELDEEAERQRKAEEHQLWLANEVRQKKAEDDERRRIEADKQRAAENRPPNATVEVRDLSQTKELKELNKSFENRKEEKTVAMSNSTVALNAKELIIEPEKNTPAPHSQRKIMFAGIGVGAVIFLLAGVGLFALNPFGSGSKVKVINANVIHNTNVAAPPENISATNSANTSLSETPKTAPEIPKTKEKTENPKPTPAPKQTPKQEKAEKPEAPPPTPEKQAAPPPAKKNAPKPKSDPDCMLTDSCKE